MSFNTRSKQYATGVDWIMGLTNDDGPADLSAATSVIVNCLRDGDQLFREPLTLPLEDDNIVSHTWADNEADQAGDVYLTVEAWWPGGSLTIFPLLGTFKHTFEPLGYTPTPPP